MSQKIRRFFPLGFLLIIMLAFYLSGLYQYFTWEKFTHSYEDLQKFTLEHPFLTPILFILIYSILSAILLPFGAFFAVLAGFLFELPFSTIYVVIAGTLGSFLIYLASRHALRDYFKKKAGPRLKKMAFAFKKKEKTYLLLMRLIPIFPSWLVSFASGLFNVHPWTFLWTTALGILPIMIAFTVAGEGLEDLSKTHEPLSFYSVLNLETCVALGALGILTILPLFFKKWRKKKT
jgi:uncharacterized membrane protein YdjX (TVP38/TMEM64 family)